MRTKYVRNLRNSLVLQTFMCEEFGFSNPQIMLNQLRVRESEISSGKEDDYSVELMGL